ncbi:MAG: hypothetical protein AB7V42_07190 [Thermoleophilia bacterium]
MVAALRAAGARLAEEAALDAAARWVAAGEEPRSVAHLFGVDVDDVLDRVDHHEGTWQLAAEATADGWRHRQHHGHADEVERLARQRREAFCRWRVVLRLRLRDLDAASAVGRGPARARTPHGRPGHRRAARPRAPGDGDDPPPPPAGSPRAWAIAELEREAERLSAVGERAERSGSPADAARAYRAASAARGAARRIGGRP